MYRILIVDDEQQQAQAIEALVARHPRASEFAVAWLPSVTDFEEAASAGNVCDILVMDIDFGEGRPSGIEAVRRCLPASSGTQVMYVTGHMEYCTSVYRTDHVYFLVKPVNQRDFDDALDKALSRLEAAHPSLVVRSGGRVVLVDPRKLAYVESDRRKAHLHLPGEVIDTYAALADLIAELPSSFVQCHKSFLVNMDHIAELSQDSVRLMSGEVIPISQKRRKSTRESFFAHIRKRL
ncbi:MULTISPECIES: LytR/AlgR family response regulator transcription factor [Gordonibacter]|uniref:LytTR family DNA-binding domain-containing protein n=1 Tax=Gordonibacter faecis TaxID=3047475 RepID=A0ABT7DNX3_9ACTN|nr:MULTISPECIES: LytTR family DNA-binding domain-containing protein [unclassified Gordonibacter]MDJ1650236.1 LytTR family DNA-binding domain-containing protein [Gordonibacter sp. KGMB12511]HIW75932.1 LytTR family DNA-binding domain-containing protein [Candidatus Gordonibacter avicola]